MPDDGAPCKMKRRWSGPRHTTTGLSHATNGQPFQHHHPPATPKLPRAEGQLSELPASGRTASSSQVGRQTKLSRPPRARIKRCTLWLHGLFRTTRRSLSPIFSRRPGRGRSGRTRRRERTTSSHLFTGARSSTGHASQTTLLFPQGPRPSFCECVLLHKSHKKSAIHRRTGAQGDGAPMSDPRGNRGHCPAPGDGSRVREVAPHSGCGYSGSDLGNTINAAERPPRVARIIVTQHPNRASDSGRRATIIIAE
ncbi:hypothetical protein HPB50_005352 [Hyalomma asiaticum]|uniref:Uncharacterized protein n=1 Tax=Hyalomma asiaticum TaxID=266040 RepID=A0ACB7SIB9_HYAAI|nr:hypothetical protein HPB50_005352 [Hyalomma asiaticum]